MANNLEARIRQNTGREVQESAPPTLMDQIRQMEDQFQLAMPRGYDAGQLVRDALTEIRKTPKLTQCDAPSVLGALMSCAQLGLRPGVLGHAWVLPYWDRHSGGFRAQLQLGYQGLVELAYRSGGVGSLVARSVHEKDEFEVAYGINDVLVHRPYMEGDRGPAVAYYALVKFVNGSHSFWVMSRSEMEEYREKHASARTRQGKIVGPWVTDFDAMAAKTCVRQLAKWMPKSTELALGVAVDETVRVDLSPGAVVQGERPPRPESPSETVVDVPVEEES